VGARHQGRHIRPGIARAVIESGWNLNELHGMALSLEEIFLELTSSHKPEAAEALKEAAAENAEEVQPEVQSGDESK